MYSDRIKNIKVRRSITSDGITSVEVNIDYPYLINYSDDDPINKFYFTISQNFLKYCEDVSGKINQDYIESSDFKKMGGVLKFYTSYLSDDYVSFVFDSIWFDGFFKSLRRFSQTWCLKSKRILPVKFFLNEYGYSRRDVKVLIGNIISENIKKNVCDFSYNKKNVKKYLYHVNPDNFFLCRNGIAFWFEPGTIVPENEGIPTYIIPIKNKSSE